MILFRFPVAVPCLPPVECWFAHMYPVGKQGVISQPLITFFERQARSREHLKSLFHTWTGRCHNQRQSPRQQLDAFAKNLHSVAKEARKRLREDVCG